MARFSLRSALTALTLGVAVLGSATLVSGDASAKGMGGMHGGGKFHGGGFHGGGKFHGGFGRWHGGLRVGLYAPAYVGVSYVGGCVVRQVIDEDGDILLRRICY